jgi:phosphopantothenoylcysteine decarboxylase/phosphopantothenate--cysteine ligase
MARIIITCGPSFAPIDEVRRITNFSTGGLGITLANAFAAAGHDVLCLKGEAATSARRIFDGVKVRSFSTNDDLAERLLEAGTADAIFQVAALCDYEVDNVCDAMGQPQRDAKIPSRAGGLVLRLKPARKILPGLRQTFPTARIVGWKYELNGWREDALAAARRQIVEAGTNLCVVNGAAYGAGFGLLRPDGTLKHAATAQDLCTELVEWMAGA